MNGVVKMGYGDGNIIKAVASTTTFGAYDALSETTIAITIFSLFQSFQPAPSFETAVLLLILDQDVVKSNGGEHRLVQGERKHRGGKGERLELPGVSRPSPTPQRGPTPS
ncbi:hypothetical protein RJT34_33041 [Clitoria ternatea]|uniref:Uncharacterized protein n=1 Tax=Clitoria ternatea TaxID=43366 RepID=A0AAN9IA27_CLITE